jgi:hypothetical protein
MMRSWRWGAIVVTWVTFAGQSDAGAPRVRFDTDAVVGCSDVTSPEFAHANPGEKLIEARFLISSLIGAGESDEQLQQLYTIESRQRTLQVEDYQPKTTLAADVVGNVFVEKKDETSKSLGLNLGASYEKIVTGNVTAGGDKRNGVITKYEKLPPLELLSASGPIRRGSGVYFKLKPSSQTSLEGAQAFAVIFRVPAAWRGDCVYIHCEAWSVPKGFTSAFTEPARVGGGDYFVALHLEGDTEAKAAAHRFARAELGLRSVAARYGDEIERRSVRTLPQLGAFVSMSQRKLPGDWLARLMYSPPAANHQLLLEQLPGELRTAGEAYVAARLRLADLNGWGETAPAVVSNSAP